MILLFEIVEKFLTISGEAPAAGKPVYLVRFAGCNLNCSYCDTVYNTEVNLKYSMKEMTEDIAGIVRSYPGIAVLLTGGEPLLEDRQGMIAELASKFTETVFYVETNGSVKISDFSNPNLRYVVDWKTKSSGHGNSFVINNLDKLRSGLDVIKIVTDKSDLDDLMSNISLIRNVNKDIEIFLSPQWGGISFEELCAFIIDNKLPVSLSLQLHKIIWGDKRGV